MREIALEPGTVLAFYTDGLVEYDHDLLAGDRRLHELFGTLVAHEPRATLARDLRASVFSEGALQEDDAAVLTIALLARARAVEWRVPAVPASIPALRGKLRDFWLETPCGGGDPFDFIVATGEALANAVEHAYSLADGSLSVRASYDEGGVSVEVEDQGTYGGGSSTPDRGFGTTIMQGLASEFDVVRGAGGTVVKLAFNAGSRGSTRG